jgi:hypothetical protein
MQENNTLRKAVLMLMLPALIMGVLVIACNAQAQGFQSELESLRKAVASPDTRTRVSATHTVWNIGLNSVASADKILALQLLKEPVGSASDQIRIPAVYAIAEIANSSNDVRVKQAALQSLAETMNSDQLVIRDIAMDAINSIVRETAQTDVIAEQIVALLKQPLNSGNNGARMPAINSLVHAIVGAGNERASIRAIDLLALPLHSEALIGGMEVKMMAIRAIDRIATDASQEFTKLKAIDMLEAFSNKSTTEPEARAFAASAIANIGDSIQRQSRPRVRRTGE